MHRNKNSLIVIAVSCLLFGGQLHANDNWPQWRGANLDSVSHESNLPVKFDKQNNMLWRLELPGPAGASPVVWEDQIFLTTVDADDNIWLFCVGADGQQQWKQQLQGKNRNTRMDRGNSASPSPSTDGRHVWANSAAGFLECFDMDGNPVWSVDLQERYGRFDIQFGMTSTPILDNGRLYLQMIHGSMRDRSTSTGYVVAIDAATGKNIWTHERRTDATVENKHSYASPTICRDGEHEYLITHGGDYVIGHSLDDGSEIWRCGGMNPQGQSYNRFLRFVASPTYVDGKIIVPSAKSGPVLCLKTDLSGDVTDDKNAFHWVLDRGTPDVATPVYHNGLVFLARENGAMLCLDAKTGEQVYMERMFADRHRSTPVVADGKVFVAGRDGTILVLTADRQGTVLAENELDEETLASPAIADGRIYIRTFEALYCFANDTN